MTENTTGRMIAASFMDDLTKVLEIEDALESDAAKWVNVAKVTGAIKEKDLPF